MVEITDISELAERLRNRSKTPVESYSLAAAGVEGFPIEEFERSRLVVKRYGSHPPVIRLGR